MTRRWWVMAAVAAGWFGAAAAVAVNPRPEGPPPAEIAEEAAQFAPQLLLFAQAVQREYVTEVDRVEILVAALGGLYEAARQPLPPGLRDDLKRLTEGEQLIYLFRRRAELGRVEALAGRKAIAIAMQASVAALDPHCGVAGPSRRGLPFDETEFGAGLEFANAPSSDRDAGTRAIDLIPSAILIRSVTIGSPAQKAGLRPGDRIVRVDGKPCDKLTPVEYVGAFLSNQRGEGRPRTLDVVRDGAAPFAVKLAPGPYYPECVYGARREPDGQWDYLLDPAGRIGYIRVGSIEVLAGVQFADALQSLVNQKARGLVLDLRWCPGGYLDPAVSLTKLLLRPGQPVASIQRRGERMVPVEAAPDGEPVVDLPLVVLINGETMGGGEMVAAALQDHKRGILVGERTFGKATVQQSLEHPVEGIPFKITKGLLRPPGGRNLQKPRNARSTDVWGVSPDPGRWLPLSPEAGARLKEWWTWQALRPANDRTALPTDDPDSDPQLKAALDILRELARRRA